MITLGLNEPGMLKQSAFDPWQWKHIKESTFDELYEDAFPTLQPGVRYHRRDGLWLELLGTVKLSESDTYPEDTGRLWRQGHNAF